MNNTLVEERCLQNIKQLGFRYKSTWSSRCNQQPLQDILDSQYNEYITKTRLYIFLFDKNVEGFADLANSLSKHSPRFFQHLCVCVSSFLRLHTSSDVWSHILITQIPLTLRTIAVAGPQQCVPEVFLRVPKNITVLTQEASCAGIPLPVLVQSLVLLDVCCGSIERGVISDEAREQCISPLCRSPLLKVFPQSAASVSLSYRIFSDTVLPVFFFFMGSMGFMGSKIKVLFPVQQLFRVILV